MCRILHLNLNYLITLYDEKLTDLIDKHAPLKKRYVHVRPKAPWMNGCIFEEKRIKRKLERGWRISKLEGDRKKYTDQRKRYNKLLIDAHTQYFSRLVSENSGSPSDLFKIIDSLLNNADKKRPLPEHTSAYTLASKFNDFFLQKVKAIHGNLETVNSNQNYGPITDEKRYHSTLTCFKQLSEEDVSKLISASSKKSCSLDPIPTWLLVKCQPAIMPVITRIINSSISLSHMPNALKSSVVAPILKKAGLSLILKNFRPVSNLKFISKLIERSILDQFLVHLKINNILEPMQSAYRQGHSTETALLRVQNDILCAMDNQNVTLLLLLDLSAAFDTVSHSILIKRLRDRVGVKHIALDWFISYLSGRKQCVGINGIMSEIVELLYGVPQGSVLGPILFLIYVLPLAEILRSRSVEFHFYADDTQIYMSFVPTLSDAELTLKLLSDCVNDIKK